jgi:hypothetical protein
MKPGPMIVIFLAVIVVIVAAVELPVAEHRRDG